MLSKIAHPNLSTCDLVTNLWSTFNSSFVLIVIFQKEAFAWSRRINTFVHSRMFQEINALCHGGQFSGNICIKIKALLRCSCSRYECNITRWVTLFFFFSKIWNLVYFVYYRCHKALWQKNANFCYHSLIALKNLPLEQNSTTCMLFTFIVTSRAEMTQSILYGSKTNMK